MKLPKQRVLFFGAAIFSWLTITSICYTLFLLIRDSMMITNVDATHNLIISNVVNILVFTFLNYLVLKNVKKLNSKAFVILTITFIVIQLFQFIYTYYFYEYIYDVMKIDISKYFNSIENLFVRFQLGSLIETLKYLITILMIVIFSKKPKLIS